MYFRYSATILLAFVIFIALPITGLKAQAPLYTKGNVLVGANFNDGPGSSDMTLIFRLMGDDEIYVDEGDDVKYTNDPDNEKVKPGWTQLKYDETGWKDGISGVGFSDNDDNTTVPAGRVSIWTRYHFDAPGASSIKELMLLVDYDDQYIAWLNGEEIARSGGAPAIKKGDEPAWNAQANVNKGSAELPAGKPNEARWKAGVIERRNIDFKFAGSSGQAVEPRAKLTSAWGRIKFGF